MNFVPPLSRNPFFPQENRLLSFHGESPDRDQREPHTSELPGSGPFPPMSPAERQSFEEAQIQRRLASWERTCRQLSEEDLQDSIESLQRTYDELQVRLFRRGEVDPRIDREGYNLAMRRIDYYGAQRDIAQRELARRRIAR